MRKYKEHFDGREVDLDDPEIYSYLPNDIDELDDLMFKEIGQALVYMDYFHPDWFSKEREGGQRKRVNQLIKDFAENRKNNYNNIMWYKEQVFLFQDETENMC